MNVSESRIISIRQPWTEAILDGFKTIENRSRGFQRSYVGWLWIHASKEWVTGPFWFNPLLLHAAWPPDSLKGQVIRDGIPGMESPELFVTGAVVGLAWTPGAHHAEPGCCATPWAEEEYVDNHGKRRTDLVHLELERVHRLREPIYTNGGLGLRRPQDPELIAELRAAADELGAT